MAKKSKTKSFKQYRKGCAQDGTDIQVEEAQTGHPYKMTYHKAHSDGKGNITHHELHHVTHHLEGKPQTREGARGMVSRSPKHQALKDKGYKPHSVGEHDRDKHSMYGRPVKHTQED